ncbi:MAG: T9SS C-terminal target domain-containing protein [Chitinophagia bacterium]|nr:T9SS C-terminal target domain-containing protein [Chitinophagia bacterium]
MTYAGSSVTPLRVSGDTVQFWLSLARGHFAVIDIHTRAATSLTWVDTVTYTATSPYPNNIAPSNDSTFIRRQVLSSYDPNEKSVNQPTYFHRENTLVYTVQYQNTGNFPAKNIIVLDSLDPNLDPETVHLITGSPAVPVMSFKDGKPWLEFDLMGINLPDSFHNEPGSHGYFMYSAQPKLSARIGDTVRNKAYIYFDYNYPVTTNRTLNILSGPYVPPPLNTKEVTMGSFKLYPNPTDGLFTVELPSNGPWIIAVSDMAGKVLTRSERSGNIATLQLKTGPGVYLVQLTNQTTGQRANTKLVVK